MSWRGFMPGDNDPDWMNGVPSIGGIFGISAFGAHNPVLTPQERKRSAPEQAMAGPYVGHMALKMEIAEVSPLLRSELPPHHWGEHPTELRDKLMRASLAAQTAQRLSDRPMRAEVTHNMHGLFTALADHCEKNGADAFVSVASLMGGIDLDGESRYATASVYNAANPDLEA